MGEPKQMIQLDMSGITQLQADRACRAVNDDDWLHASLIEEGRRRVAAERYLAVVKAERDAAFKAGAEAYRDALQDALEIKIGHKQMASGLGNGTATIFISAMEEAKRMLRVVDIEKLAANAAGEKP